MPPSPRDSSDQSPAPPPFPRPSGPSSIGCINASSTTSINSFTPWASRSPHESRPEHRTSQREQNPRYRPHNGLTSTSSSAQAFAHRITRRLPAWALMNFGPLRPLTDAPGVGDGGGLANERWGANRRMEDEAAAMTSHARDRGTLAGRSTLSAAASSGSASDENPLPTAPFRWTPQAGAIGPDRRLAAPATTRSGSACGRSSGANRKEESQNCARPTSCHVTSELASGLGQRPSFL